MMILFYVSLCVVGYKIIKYYVNKFETNQRIYAEN